MNLFPTFTRAWHAVKKVFARYEAAYQRWGERSWLPASVQDAWIDAGASTRIELMRRHRYWVKNNPIVNRIRCLKIQYAVGVEGLNCTPNSSSEDWNIARQASYEQWCRKPELHTDLTMGQLHSQWEGAMFDDGEVFIHLTHDNRNRPAIETIEAHRVGTPSDLKNEENKSIFDGIRVDSNGQKLSYFVRKPFGNGRSMTALDLSSRGASNADPVENYTEIPSEEIIHIYKSRRPGMLRGIPDGYPCMNILHDMDDYQLLEMKAAKAAARITNIVTNAAGEFDPTSLRRSKLQIQSTDSNQNAVVKNVPEFYNVTLGGDTLALKVGEDIKQFCPTRPTILTQQYWDYLCSLVCCGYNVPKLMVIPYSLQGTVTRVDVEVCTNAFRVDFEIMKWASQRIYEWHSDWDSQFNRKAYDGTVTPKDYQLCVIRPPRGPNVDIGRNANALAVELGLGTITYQDIFAERQQDYRVQFRQSAEAVFMLKKLAVEFSRDGIEVKPEEIANKLQTKLATPTPEEVGDQATAATE